MTLFLLAAVLSTAEVPAAHTLCCVQRALAHAATGSTTLAAVAPVGPREKTAVRTEAPLAAPVVAFCVLPLRRPCASYATPALPPRAPAATRSSERAPPSSLA